MPEIDITVKGTGAVSKMLQEIGDRGLDPRPAFDQATVYMVAAEKRRFDALGRVKAGTEESKAHDSDPRVRANAPRAGVATGELREFMATKGSKAQPAKMTKNELIFGVPRKHRLSIRAVSLVKSGHNPLISREVARRWVTKALTEYLAGDLGPLKSARWWRR